MSQSKTVDASPTREVGDVSPTEKDMISSCKQSDSNIENRTQVILKAEDPSRREVAASVDGDDPQKQAEKWNSPRGNVGRLAFVFVAFIIMGMNDAAVGPLIPSLEEYYNLTYTIVSLIFLTPFAGYSIAAITNSRIHMRFGQRGIAIIAPICHIVTYIVLALHPPYPVLVVCNLVSGFGNGLIDACFCAWVGVMDKTNTIQGFMHGCYSIGALFAPLIATAMVTNGLPWFYYYYVMIGISAVEMVGLVVTFWPKTGGVFREEHKHNDDQGVGIRVALRSKVTWLASIFFFTYVGAEVGLGGWIVTFMLRVRKVSRSAAGNSGIGFWAGQAAGRAALGFVTDRFGERICCTIYLTACIALHLVFWLVPNFIVSAIAVALLGFFMGPLFPAAITMTAKLLPKQIHVSAIGFAMAIGGTGGTVFPFIIGAAAESKGVTVLQPIVLSLIAVVGLVWLAFPATHAKDESWLQRAKKLLGRSC